MAFAHGDLAVRRNGASIETIQAYKRLTKRASRRSIANTYLAGTNTRPCPLERWPMPVRGQGRQGLRVSHAALAQRLKTDWESWQARDLSGEDIVRLDPGWQYGVKARLDWASAVNRSAAWSCLGVRRDFRTTKVLLAVKMHTLLDLRGKIPSFIGISDAMSWRTFIALDMLLKEAGASDRRRRASWPGGGDLASLYVLQRYSGAASSSRVHKERNLDRPSRRFGVARRGQGRLRPT